MSANPEETPKDKVSKAELATLIPNLAQFKCQKPERGECLESLLDHVYIGSSTARKSTLTSRRRTIFRFWPRDPNGAVIRCTPKGNVAPNSGSLWGATLYDFYHTNRIPDVTCSVTKTTGNKLMQWCKENSELEWAKDEIAWAEREALPKKIQGPNLAEVHTAMVDMRVPQTNWAKAIIEKKKDNDDKVNHHTPFHPSSYPPPYPIPPFSCPVPNLEETVPLHLLPQKLIVHDPHSVLGATNPRPDYADRERTASGKWVDMWPYDSSSPTEPQGYRTRIYNLDVSEAAEAKIDEARSQTTSADTRNQPETAMYIFPSTASGPTATPLIRVTVPSRPPKPTHTPEAHLYMTKHKKKGEGHHSYVYDVEWEVPRWWFVDPVICMDCVEEKAQEIWSAEHAKSQSTPDESPQRARELFDIGDDVPEDTEDLKRYLEQLEREAADVDAMDIDDTTNEAPGDTGRAAAEPDAAAVAALLRRAMSPLPAIKTNYSRNGPAAASVVSIPDSGIAFSDTDKPHSPLMSADVEMASPTLEKEEDGPFASDARPPLTHTTTSTSAAAPTPESLDHLLVARMHIPICAMPSNAVRSWPSLAEVQGRPVGNVELEMRQVEPEERMIFDVVHEHVLREVHDQKRRRTAAEEEKAGQVSETQWLDGLVRGLFDKEQDEDAKPFRTFKTPGVDCDDTDVKYVSYTAYTGEMREIHITSVPWLLPGDAPCSKHPRSSAITPGTNDLERVFGSQPDISSNPLQDLSSARTPPTMKVKLTAKLGMYGDSHLAHEGLAYQKFSQSMSEHWTGYNVVYPLHEPTPCGAITPGFYGFYKPDKEASDHPDYLSPILLLEDCGKPIVPEKLCLDDKYECSALLLRFHYLGWTQGSFYPRNILMRSDFGGEEGKNKRRFRLIDFGRASYIVDKENEAGDDESLKKSARNEWDKSRFDEKCSVSAIMGLPFPM
ncbi:hypothetical protein VNI00_013932 [Paramarasmius palmivorus]|uniref:Protein kinase domain-containing protein n=1 Tax=Paramarasmius palmivorus TaxID=297713 RepID=A0AAW0C027_9AGAR